MANIGGKKESTDCIYERKPPLNELRAECARLKNELIITIPMHKSLSHFIRHHNPHSALCVKVQSYLLNQKKNASEY